MTERLREKCGVVGVFGHPEASTLAYLGLHALQHRGQESAGVVSSDGTLLRLHRAMGLVTDVFSPEILKTLSGDRAIGHVRYSTSGDSALENAQPLMIREQGGLLSVAHNGNLVNADEIRLRLESQGAVFSSSSDTEVLLHLIAREHSSSLATRIERALLQVRGAYSLVFLTTSALVVARDPYGFRPLVLGRLRGGWVVASESCAFNLIGAEFVREVEPGELIVIDSEGLHSRRLPEPERRARCIFELVYFARPDSRIFDRSVYETRRELGRVLARARPVDADLVLPVPDSGVPGALGFSEASGLPFEMGLIRSHYIGRTFIEPSDSIRHFGVRLKLSPIADVVRGKRVAVVDDSIVRGTTSRKIVRMLRDAGAREVHLRVTAPPTRFPCHYGIATPTRTELLAATHAHDALTESITADSVGYLSIEELHEAARSNRREFCDACFSGIDPLTPLGLPGTDG